MKAFGGVVRGIEGARVKRRRRSRRTVCWAKCVHGLMANRTNVPVSYVFPWTQMFLVFRFTTIGQCHGVMDCHGLNCSLEEGHGSCTGRVRLITSDNHSGLCWPLTTGSKSQRAFGTFRWQQVTLLGVWHGGVAWVGTADTIVSLFFRVIPSRAYSFSNL